MSSLSVYESFVHELDVRWDPFLDESNEAQVRSLPLWTETTQSHIRLSSIGKQGGSLPHQPFKRSGLQRSGKKKSLTESVDHTLGDRDRGARSVRYYALFQGWLLLGGEAVERLLNCEVPLRAVFLWFQLPGYTKAHQSTLYYSAYTWGLRPRSSLERRTLAGSEALLSFAYPKEEGALISELGWRAEPAEPPAGEWLAAHLFREGK
ncbi:hypothetical protein FXO38_14566 [Capsicum annuum]|nr:hypothetical protein FXO38_14566 [Capsicum annuum]